MPIKIQRDLPAKAILESENIFVMDEERALSQDIRPLEILILNLMPVKEETELQLLRALSNTPLQINCTLLRMATHVSKNTSATHLERFYRSFAEIRGKRYDGMIITGAPVETMEFEEVNYWPELEEILGWTRDHVTSTFHICWGAQVGLYYHYGIPKLSRDGRQIFVQGHPEYDRMTLDGEYRRDLERGLNPSIPCNYYENDDPEGRPILCWRNMANTLYSNWLNYYVYQVTPYELEETEI